MNDDLFAAHFLLRKMQEDEWGKFGSDNGCWADMHGVVAKWLHAILHQTGERHPPVVYIH
jgi:hypothetical protein